MVGVMLPDDTNNFMDQIIRNFETDNVTDLSKFVPKVFGMETMEPSFVPKFTTNTTNFNDINLAKILIGKNQKESLAATKSALIETIKEKEVVVNSKLPTSVILDTILKADLGSSVFSNYGTLIVAAAHEEIQSSLKDRTVATKTQRHLRSVVKLIISQTSETNSHPVSQLIALLSEPLIRHRDKGEASNTLNIIPFHFAIDLSIICFSLRTTQPSSVLNDMELIYTLCDVLAYYFVYFPVQKCPSWLTNLHATIESAKDLKKVMQIGKERLSRYLEDLFSLCSARATLSDYKNVYRNDNGICVYSPLIKQVISDLILNLKISTDIKQVSSEITLGNMLTSSLTRFAFNKTTTNSFLENKLIMIFIIGGINYSEIQIIREIANQKPDYQIFVGSTALVTPSQAAQSFFSSKT